MDPVDAKDKYGVPAPADAMVDISGVLDLKTRMLACHASQRDWLLAHHGVDEYLDAMKRHGRLRGRQATANAEVASTAATVSQDNRPLLTAICRTGR
jgi:LmbE family N-acetylglucosaminyl deacetylase